VTTKLVRYSKLTYHEDYSQSKEDWFERPGSDEHIQYTCEIGERFLIDNGFEHVLNRLLCLKRIPKFVGLYNKAIDGLCSVGLRAGGVDELKTTLSSIHLPPENGGIMRVPKSMNQFLDMDADDIGKGEIAYMLLSADDIVHNPSERYDVSINGSFWHMKDCRKHEGCRMGRPKGANDEERWLDAPIIQFILSVKRKYDHGKDINFGTTLFKHRDVRNEFLKRYDVTDDTLAMQMLENELDAVVYSSAEFGKAVGIIELVYDDDDNACFRRVNKENVHFYAISQDGLQITSRPDRFVNVFLRSLKRETKNENRSRRRKHEARS
jgi:hypothetical protein